jgi:triosephosphate isomerase
MRKQIAAANWKMNIRLEEGLALIDSILSKNINLQSYQQAIFAVPFPYLIPAREKFAEVNNCFVAAQNCSSNNNGAFTGEVSAQMLSSLHIPYVIIGHSERREYNHESNEELAKKTDKAMEAGLNPIFCCGESLQVRESGNQNVYVQNQLQESLFHLDATKLKDFIIAYEPIWAIGTGRTASSEQAQEMHAHIRIVMADKYGTEIADSISILYGGSVKANNAAEIFGQPDVDGGLVGGASLVADDFAVIMQSLKKV